MKGKAKQTLLCLPERLNNIVRKYGWAAFWVLLTKQFSNWL
jgi:hypothetical protein